MKSSTATRAWGLLAILLSLALFVTVGYGLLQRARVVSVPLTISGEPSGADHGADARFVASRRGKYYYPFFSPEGQKLAEKNRVYFRSEEEARAEGYIHWR